MTVPSTPPAGLFEIPTTPNPATPFLVTPSTDSSLAKQPSTAPSSPLSSSRMQPSGVKASLIPSFRVQPSRLAKTKHQVFSQKNSRLLILPSEILLMITNHVRLSSLISALALRYAHPLFYVVDSTNASHIRWYQIPRQIRKKEYNIAEKCFAEGFLRGLFSTGKMPCYKCLEFKGKSCFSRDVREGNLAIGAEAFDQRRCQHCGGSEKEMRTNYLKSISTIWGMNFPTQNLPI